MNNLWTKQSSKPCYLPTASTYQDTIYFCYDAGKGVVEVPAMAILGCAGLGRSCG